MAHQYGGFPKGVRIITGLLTWKGKPLKIGLR